MANKRVIIEIDITYEGDAWGAATTQDIMGLFQGKSAKIKNFSIKNVNKQDNKEKK